MTKKELEAENKRLNDGIRMLLDVARQALDEYGKLKAILDRKLNEENKWSN